MTYFVAHRGLSSKAPENTYKAFDLAILNGSKYIEFDVQLTKDKKVVIIHDETIDRTSNGSGKVKSKTLKELLSLDFGSWFSNFYKGCKIPLFSDVLEKYKNINFVVEIKGKEEELVQEVLRIILSNNYWKSKIYKSENLTPNITFCSFLPDQIISLRKFSKDIFVWFLVKKIDNDILKFSNDLNLDGISPYYKLINKKNMLLIRNYHITCWGLQKREEVKPLLALGIEGVTVDWSYPF